MFFIGKEKVDIEKLQASIRCPEAGGFCSFEGWVRDNNENRDVDGLKYDVYEELAQTEGEKILKEAHEKFDICKASAMHRAGDLEIGDMAVWIGVSAPHRDAAFKACRYIIDEIKDRLPIWKNEAYKSGEREWVKCQTR